MADFSIGKAFDAGFRLIRRKPGALGRRHFINFGRAKAPTPRQR